MADFSETQGGGALANMLAASFNAGSNQEMYAFKIGMQDTGGTLRGSLLDATLSAQETGTEPATLTFSVTANAFAGNVAYTLDIDTIRLYFSTSAATTTFTDWVEIPLGANYAMDNAGYTLDLTSFSITLDNFEN